jgi:hypothetical protein
MVKTKVTKKVRRSTGSSHRKQGLQRYSKKDFALAMKECRDNKNPDSVRTIARQYEIPHSTLSHRLTTRKHLGVKARTLGGYRQPKILSTGIYKRLCFL